jgi:hypothetical protein
METAAVTNSSSAHRNEYYFHGLESIFSGSFPLDGGLNTITVVSRL